jgi:hypothetical protein
LVVWLFGCLVVWLFCCLVVWLFGCLVVLYLLPSHSNTASRIVKVSSHFPLQDVVSRSIASNTLDFVDALIPVEATKCEAYKHNSLVLPVADIETCIHT